MEKFEEYAEAVRSGRVTQVGEPEVMYSSPSGVVMRPVAKESRQALYWAIGIVALIFGALVWLGWQKDIKQTVEAVERDVRAEFVAWAQNVGIGLDCHSMTVKNKQQVILHNCRFTTASERAQKNITPL